MNTTLDNITKLQNLAFDPNSNAFNISLKDSLTIKDKNLDGSGKSATHSIFGDTITGTRIAQITAQFQYGIGSEEAKLESINGGYIDTLDSILHFHTTSDVGSTVNIQSVETLRYIPGQEVYCYYTIVYNEPILGQKQIAGLFDSENGFGLGYCDTTDFCFMHRRKGVTTYYPIDLDSFNEQNGYIFNPQKGNIYKISFGYLGFATIMVDVLRPDGTLANLHKFQYPNNNIVTHITQTFLPVRAEVSNQTGNTPMVVGIGSLSAGIVNGSSAEYTSARKFTYANATEFTINGATPLITFRNKATYNDIVNYVKSRLIYISGANDLNKNAKWVIIKNPVFTNTPTWTSPSVDSVMEISTDATMSLVTNTKYLLAFNNAKVNSFLYDVLNYQIDLRPNEWATIALLGTGIGSADLSMRWTELF